MGERVLLFSALWMLAACDVYYGDPAAVNESAQSRKADAGRSRQPSGSGGIRPIIPKPSDDAGRPSKQDAGHMPAAGVGGIGEPPAKPEDGDMDGGSQDPTKLDSGPNGAGGTWGIAGRSGGGSQTGTGNGTCSERDARVWNENGHCYFVLTTPASWATSREECEERSATLAAITSRPERVFTEALIRGRPHWIGLSNSGSGFSWVTGELVDYTHWEWNSPRGFGQSAVAIRDETGLWFDDERSESYAALCERE